ncbi:T9SS type A sorting domain-containing protein [Candidatus Acetothermia bacterium]|nr:T9SS type A sorting domain-containing protein [Candidatus Acetothermia bacterium]
MAGNFGIRATVLPVFGIGGGCTSVTSLVKPSGTVVYQPKAKKAAKQTFKVTITNQSGLVQTVNGLVTGLGNAFTITSISPTLPRTIKNGKKQSFTVKTERAAGLGIAVATAPFFTINLSCGVLTTAGLLAQPVLFSSQGIRVEVEGVGIESVQLQLFDLTGRQLLERTTEGTALSLPGADESGRLLSNGVYLYVVTAKDGAGNVLRSVVRKLVIRR